MLGMILSGLELTDLTFDLVIKALAALIVVWFVIKNYLDMKNAAKIQIVTEESWDYAAQIVKEKEKEWDDGLSDVDEVRKQIVKRYDERLDELKTDLETKIDDNATDTNAKMQEMQSEIFILTECMRAVLDGLHQQGCNGEVTKTRERLDSYFVRKACCGEEPQW